MCVSWLPMVYVRVRRSERWEVRWRRVKCKIQALRCAKGVDGWEGGGRRRGMSCVTERANKLTLPVWPTHVHNVRSP